MTRRSQLDISGFSWPWLGPILMFEFQFQFRPLEKFNSNSIPIPIPIEKLQFNSNSDYIYLNIHLDYLLLLLATTTTTLFLFYNLVQVMLLSVVAVASFPVFIFLRLYKALYHPCIQSTQHFWDRTCQLCLGKQRDELCLDKQVGTTSTCGYAWGKQGD